MAKQSTKRPARKRSVKLLSLPGDDGAHYTPVANGMWLRSRLSKGTWRHSLTAKPAIAASGGAGPKLASTMCPIDGCEYLYLGNNRYWRVCPGPGGTSSAGPVDASQVPPACRST